MKKSCKNCIWYEDCKAAGEIRPNCDDHSPIDESEINERYYINDLKRRTFDYDKLIKEFNEKERSRNKCKKLK